MTKKNILIIWEGLPSCSLLISDLINQKDYSLDLAFTRPKVPFKNIKDNFKGINRIIELSNLDEISKIKKLYLYDLIICTGWKSKITNKLLFKRKKINKSAINVCAIDNTISPDFCFNSEGVLSGTILKQIFGAIYYRFFLRKVFDYCFVPGNSSSLLMRLFGHRSDLIFNGYYGAYENIYFSNNLFQEKENQFLYVGQLIERKGIKLLINSFMKYLKKNGSWKLLIIGGTESEFLKICPFEFRDFIKHISFLQPNKIAEKMRISKCFILPSLYDHWGTVLCEAALTGSLLIASDQSGSTTDLIKRGINGFTFNSKSKNSEEILSKLMYKIEKISAQKDSHQRSETSIKVASTYSSSSYKLAIKAMFE
tara:strand:- start:4673 stop:5776 length:1104 start_codon:yes stop_codon:yes gene_type:complete